MPRRTFSCFLIGENSMVAACAELLVERGHRVLGVVSSDDRVREWAERGGLPATGFGADLASRVAAAGPFDYLFSIANLRMLPEQVLALPRKLAINFHDGPLPRHAGLHATTWAIRERATSHGVTWHVMTARADTGDILLQRPIPVSEEDTSHTLNVTCFEAGVESFGELIDALAEGRAERRPQDLSRFTYHGRFDRPVGGGFLSWERPARELDAAVRATDFGPHPNAFGTAKAALPAGPVVVRGLEVLPTGSGRPPGTVVEAGGDGVVVTTTDHDVRLTGLASSRGEPLTASDLADLGCLPGCRLPAADPVLLDAATGAEAARLRAEPFWVRRLTDLLPADLPYPDTSSARAVVPRTAYRIALPDQVEHAAATAGLGRQQWLLTAFLAFLARIGVETGTDVHLRLPDGKTGHPAVEALYSAYAPLRLPAPEGRTMADLGAEVGRRLAEATRRGPYPHDLWIRYPRLRDRRPAQPGLPIAVEFVRDTAGPAAPPDGTALLIRIPLGDGPCQWVVAEGAFSQGTAGPTAEYAAAFLRAAAAAGDREVTAIELGGQQARRVVAAANDTAADFPLHCCVHQLVARQAAARPDAPAVIFGDTALGFGELDRRSSLLAGHLRARGIGPGRMVGVYLKRSADLVVALLAVMKSGAAYVPLDPVYPPDRIAYIIGDTALGLLVTESDLAGELPPGGADVLALDRAWPEVLAGTPEPGADVDSATDAYVIYTSGSTGRPKGVRVSHRALTNFVCAMAREPGFTERDRLLAVTTVCFDIAGLELYVPLVTGGRVELASAETAADGFLLRKLLEASRPTVMQATPATWRMLLDAGWRGRPGGEVLRMLCGGEPLPADLADALLARGTRLSNMYGPTETTIWSSVAEVTSARRITIGRPIANTRFHVLDRWRRPLPPGLPGELYIGGAGVASGYLNRPELTAERFVPDTLGPDGGALYRTGDLVRQLPDGQLECLGRVDDQVKLHGYRIEPGEIEAALRGHPAVAEAVVAVREDAPGDRRLVGYVVPREPGVAAGLLRAHLAALLPSYMIPAAFVELGRLPLTANGKTDRRALPRPSCPAGSDGPDGDAGDRAQRAVAGIWREVLRLDRVGMDDNFFEVGGDSLLLMRVMARLKDLEDICPRPPTRVEMFRYPTVRSLARHLAGTDGPPGPVEASRGRSGRGALGELRGHRRGQPVHRPAVPSPSDG
ncbi:amino acid adenylation domain-containing protein [Streptomyces sp. NPDC002928]|uniref:amino acid adenylation domain-containing protein n=1 Tax=Streptomyces sp. NPDC002928 TaxID=3154440 RepID=UPI0033A608FB